jgi:hypothetical protein
MMFHLTRCHFLRSLVGGSLLMPGILSRLLAADADSLAPKPPHYPAKAQRVIFLYTSGGVSQVEPFDPKPRLVEDGGKQIGPRTLLRPKWNFHGVHVHDLHATILHLLGFDHERLTDRHAGRDFRLTDVSGRVVREILL